MKCSYLDSFNENIQFNSAFLKTCLKIWVYTCVAYASSSLVIKIIQNAAPQFLNTKLRETLFTTRRKPLIGRFYDNARGKTGKWPLQNRLQHMDCLNKEWLEWTWTNDVIRTTLKKTLFNLWHDFNEILTNWHTIVKNISYLSKSVNLFIVYAALFSWKVNCVEQLKNEE